jgi:uncharacterized protein YecE (DUF72 family)
VNEDPQQPRVHVGSSGWSYPEWRGSFYPAGAKPNEFLRRYAERLNAVELNATFYRLPAEAQFESWAAQTPPGFEFAVKLPGQISHGGRLDRIATFAERVQTLGAKLGPILVRVPDDRPRDNGFLRLLLDSLPPELRVAVDARHPSWADAEIPVRVNEWDGPFVYLRPTEPGDLEELAARIRADDREVYCFFNRGEADDHTPGGVPTAEHAAKLIRLLA